ncbi:hypothetical protein CQW23_34376 [Capsicum baccatum]|uniref:Uncharacterized protein n=1 Tax=Capsicum baccatum TaxID=33114 RepID=A0A2G2UZ22_CAPBA|nr:hypothetical protein CQW23_34376 [Capsicum baccatum]
MRLQISNDSVEAHIVTTDVLINRTEGNMQMQNIERIDFRNLRRGLGTLKISLLERFQGSGSGENKKS